MIWWIIGLGLALCAGAGTFLGLYRAFQSPTFVAGLATIVVKALLPLLLAVFKPKDFTEQQLEKIRRGENPFAAGHGHGGENH